jgi:LysR family cys regulon transcriptional activator
LRHDQYVRSLDQWFEQRSIRPRIVAEMAVRDDPACASGGDLVIRPAGTLFGNNVARLAFKRGAYLRNFVYGFAELLSPKLTRKTIERALSGDPDPLMR